MMPGKKPVEQCRPGVADVDIPGWARRKSNSNIFHFHLNKAYLRKLTHVPMPVQSARPDEKVQQTAQDADICFGTWKVVFLLLFAKH